MKRYSELSIPGKLSRLIIIFLIIGAILALIGMVINENGFYIAAAYIGILAFITFIALLLYYIFNSVLSQYRSGPGLRDVYGKEIIITTGKENTLINKGQEIDVNIAKGKDINQTINKNLRVNLSEFIVELKTKLDALMLGANDKQDIENEVNRIETQLAREDPRFSIINGALKVIGGILIGVAGNALTGPLLEKINWLLAQFR